eukprot:5451200-Prymnesium_polylepis.1
MPLAMLDSWRYPSIGIDPQPLATQPTFCAADFPLSAALQRLEPFRRPLSRRVERLEFVEDSQGAKAANDLCRRVRKARVGHISAGSVSKKLLTGH